MVINKATHSNGADCDRISNASHLGIKPRRGGRPAKDRSKIISVIFWVRWSGAVEEIWNGEGKFRAVRYRMRVMVVMR